MIAKIIKLLRAVQLALTLWWLRLKAHLNRLIQRVFGINLRLLGMPNVLKVPKHLGIHIELDPLSTSYEIEETVKAIAKLILWGFDTGTEFITIFEPSDFLSDPANLMSIMKHLKAEYSESCNFENDSTTQITKDVKLRILSKEDGHDDLLRLIKDIANENRYAIKDINEELITKELSSNINGIPMDCILGISRHEIIASFPPWLLRNAEIFIIYEDNIDQSL